jgi:hypothetical protein
MLREANDGGWIDEAMECGGRKERPGFLCNPVRKRPAALCGGAGAAGGLWRREVYGRGLGGLAAPERAGACRARCAAP